MHKNIAYGAMAVFLTGATMFVAGTASASVAPANGIQSPSTVEVVKSEKYAQSNFNNSTTKKAENKKKKKKDKKRYPKKVGS